MSDRAIRNEKLNKFAESLKSVNPFVKKEPKSEELQEIVSKGIKVKIVERAANDK